MSNKDYARYYALMYNETEDEYDEDDDFNDEYDDTWEEEDFDDEE